MATKKKDTYKFYCDPGHGWLAVKRQELIDLGILAKISPYSYQKGATVYLEEDCDLSVFMAAKRELGEAVNIVEKHTDKSHPIRSYDYFSIRAVGE